MSATRYFTVLTTGPPWAWTPRQCPPILTGVWTGVISSTVTSKTSPDDEPASDGRGRARLTPRHAAHITIALRRVRQLMLPFLDCLQRIAPRTGRRLTLAAGMRIPRRYHHRRRRYLACRRLLASHNRLTDRSTDRADTHPLLRPLLRRRSSKLRVREPPLLCLLSGDDLGDLLEACGVLDVAVLQLEEGCYTNRL